MKKRNESFTYYVLKPQTKVVGILVLLHCSGENPKSIFRKTSLPRIMSNKGFLIIAPELQSSLI